MKRSNLNTKSYFSDITNIYDCSYDVNVTADIKLSSFHKL